MLAAELARIGRTEKTVKIAVLGTKPPFASSNLVARVLLDMGTLAAIEWVLGEAADSTV